MNKKVAIIIPTHNRALYLARLLDQLLNQDLPPDQIIVVDDHSTDTTQEIVRRLHSRDSRLWYMKNQGRHQRDARRTGLTNATGDYIGFLDDDALIEDRSFFKKLQLYLNPHRIVHTKVVMENLGLRNIRHDTWIDRLTVRPYPILDIGLTRYHVGSQPRMIYPMQEIGNFWPAAYASFLIEPNVILDGYGESYVWAFKAYRAGLPILFVPQLVVRHPGADSGGSHTFQKKSMLRDFTAFHYGYFYNMIYMHSRFLPLWIWLWLPYFFSKAIVAFFWNYNSRGLYQYAFTPMMQSLYRHFIRRRFL